MMGPYLGVVCEHPESWRIEREYTADSVIVSTVCTECGVETLGVRGPRTTVEHLRCLNVALDELGAAVREALMDYYDPIRELVHR